MTEQICLEWVFIPGYEFRYSINEFGVIKSRDRLAKSRWGTAFVKNGKIMKQKINQDGYCSIKLYDSFGNAKHCLVHRLVAITFIPNPENLPQVNHKNNIKTDNRKVNLKWGTILSNSGEAAADGLYRPLKGSKVHNSKLVEAQILFIKNLYRDGEVLQKELAHIFGVCKQVINEIVNNKKWKHV